MRVASLGLTVAVVAASTGLLAGAQTPQTSAQLPAFRGGTDFVRLDVGVLDKQRRPIAGLAAGDFVLLEDGKAQPIVTFSETKLPVGAADAAASGSDGRIVVILMDDLTMPADALALRNAREIGHRIVDRLGPRDRAAVQFVQDNSHAVNLTGDKAKLNGAIDATSVGTVDAPVSADALFSPTAWAKSAPTVRALQDTLDALRAVPEQRKTVFYISVGTPAGALDQVFDQFYRPGRDAQAAVVQSLQATFQEAMWANVNIYAVDPEGLGGYEAYLTSRYASNFPAGTEYVHDTVRATVDYLRVVSDQTGGRAVVNTNDFNAGLDQIFNETSDYYLLGYKPAGNLSDRKYRRVQVKVDKPGVTVQARQGYFAVAK